MPEGSNTMLLYDFSNIVLYSKVKKQLLAFHIFFGAVFSMFCFDHSIHSLCYTVSENIIEILLGGQQAFEM